MGEVVVGALPRLEGLALKLRGLFEGRGYRRYRVDRFEPYEVYMTHRRFLTGDGIITFTDRAGRLMALKPDVTLGIVKNAPEDAAARKYYYGESVFRVDRRGEDYREIEQWGVEYIGADTGYATAEVVILAVKALEAVGEEFVLDIGHMGLLAALFGGLDADVTDKLLAAIKRKNQAELARLLDGYGCREAVLAVAGFRGAAAELCNIERYCAADEAKAAYAELARLAEVLRAAGVINAVAFDFSVINDMDYYNGVVFRGFVRGARRAVLSGGRYDKLMELFGKPQKAMGFAIYMTELDRLLMDEREYDADVLLVYGDARAGDVALEVERLTAKGLTVRAEQAELEGFKAREIVRLSTC